MNMLPANLFARVTSYVQGILAGLFLLGGFYSWSMKEWTPATIAKLPEFGTALPPVWFAALHETWNGGATPFLSAMARRAENAAAIAVALAVVSYFLSYRRYRKLLLETPDRVDTSGIWRWSLIRLLARSPRQEAIMCFLAQTLARSRAHRLMWFVYIGAALAVMLNSSLVDGALFFRSRDWSKALRFLVLFWPLSCSVVILSGFRHVLSIPSELRANWIFQLTESQGRSVNGCPRRGARFVSAYAIAPVYLILIPVAAYAIGWAVATRLAILQVLISLSIFELLFNSWQKLPFTCSYLPGKRPLVVIVAAYLAVLCALLPILSMMIATSSAFAPLFPIYLANFGAIWIWLRRLRREGWGDAKLIYEDLPDVVTDLGIKDVGYARHLTSPKASS